MSLSDDKVIILGCGSSRGVPSSTGNWGACDSLEPRNKRTRASICLQSEGSTLLIDTSPDLYQQMTTHKISNIDAVFYSHVHADHCHGIDDLKSIFFESKKTIPVFASKESLVELQQKFSYLFSASSYGADAVLKGYELETFTKVGPFDMVAFPQIHTPTMESWGFRWKNVAYSTDFKDLSCDSQRHLQNLDVWIIDCLSRYSYERMPHLSLEKTLEWIERLKPKRAILTHMGNTLDYQTLKRELPDYIEPAYDGMVLYVR